MVIAAIDNGGTRRKLGLVSEEGRVLVQRTADSGAAGGMGAQLPIVEREIEAALAEAGCSRGDLRGVAFGFPSLVDVRANRVIGTPSGKFDDLPSLDLGRWARERLGVSLRMENDAHAAALGEWRFGAGRGTKSLVQITLGTGIGTSVILNGVPLRGQHFQAGVLGGHFIVTPDGAPCPCGARGCTETEVGSWALPAIAREDPRFEGSALARERQVDYQAVFRLAAADALAACLQARALRYWSATVTTLIHAYDPERIIVGGGILASRDSILPALRAGAACAWTPWGRVEVVENELGETASLLGLSSLFTQEMSFL